MNRVPVRDRDSSPAGLHVGLSASFSTTHWLLIGEKYGNGADLAVDPTLTGVWAPEERLTPDVVREPAVEAASLCRPALAPVPVPSGDG
jgi:hypothetical protein